jgi:ATP synthase protein I
MPKTALQKKRAEALQLVSLPAGIVILVAVLLYLIGSKTAGISTVLGGLVWFIPNLYFAYKVFPNTKAALTPQRIVRNFYRAEVIKLLLSALIFIVILKTFIVAMLPFLAGYAIAQITFWLASLLVLLKTR